MTQEDIFVLAGYIRRNNLYSENRADVFTDAQLETIAAFCKEKNRRFDRDLWFEHIQGYHNLPLVAKINFMNNLTS